MPLDLNAPLRISEIFHSLQGEADTAGLATVFVRLTGCPMRCVYCDSAYAFSGGKKLTIADILETVQSYDCGMVTVTGGEPLAQPGAFNLLEALCDAGYQVSLETGGAIKIDAVDPRVKVVLDVKTPASKMDSQQHYGNLDLLRKHDIAKFVIMDKEDFNWSERIAKQYKLFERCQVFYSPVYQKLKEKDLAAFILDSKSKARLQIQLHKLLWGEVEGV